MLLSNFWIWWPRQFSDIYPIAKSWGLDLLCLKVDTVLDGPIMSAMMATPRFKAEQIM